MAKPLKPKPHYKPASGGSGSGSPPPKPVKPKWA